MTQGSNGPAARVLEAYRRRGQRITLRSATSWTAAMLAEAGLPAAAAPGEVLKNPPVFVAPRVVRANALGASSLTILADHAHGVLVAGDRIRVAGTTAWSTISAPAVAGTAASDPLALTAPSTVVTLAAAFPASLPAGTTLAVEFAWKADVVWWARVQSFPQQLVNGQNILAGDLRISVPAYGLAEPPKQGDRILLGTTVDAEIVYCDPAYLSGGDISHWTIVAR